MGFQKGIRGEKYIMNHFCRSDRQFTKRLMFAIILGIALMGLFGCASKKEAINPQYLVQFDAALEQMAENKYDEAEKCLLELMDYLEQEKVQSNEVAEMRADVDYAFGKLSLNRGDYYTAYDYYNSAYIHYKELFQNNGDKTLDTRIRLAEIEESYLGRNEHALSEYIDIYETCDIPKYKNVALCQAISFYMAMDNGDETEKHIGTIREIIDELPVDDNHLSSFVAETGTEAEIERNTILDRISVADQYLYSYKVLANYSDPDEAIELYETALSVLENGSINDEVEKIDFYENLGFIYLYYKGESDGNLYLEKAIKSIDEVYPIGIQRASAYVLIAEKYLAVGNYEQFGKYLNNAVDMAESTAGHNHRVVAASKILLSQYYRYIGNYQQAIESAEDAIEITKNILREDSDYIGSYYNNLASCYAMCGYKEKAVETYLKSIEVYKRFGNDLQIAVADRNVALIYNNSLHNHTLALQYAREAISLVEELDKSYYSSTIAAIYMVMADILTPLDYDYARVEEYAEKAYECLQNAVGNKDEHLANYHYNLGSYLFDNIRYSEALTHFISAEELFEIVYKDTKLYPVDIFYDIACCHYSMGGYDKALSCFEESVYYNVEHIALLHEQGNYHTSYWESRKGQAQNYIERIQSMQNID